MFRNYLLIAVRFFGRNKLISTINILGFSLAMTGVIMIYLYISDELSFDRHHTKSERMYRVTRTFFDSDGATTLSLATIAPPIGPLLQNDFGQIESNARTLQNSMVMGIEENGELTKMAAENNVFLAEPSIFQIFDIPLLSGNSNTALEQPMTIMLSERAALKYFNNTDIIGKTMKAGSSMNLQVVGVFKDFPTQSHWHPDFLISFSTLNDDAIYGRALLETNWGNNSFSTYLLLEQGADPSVLANSFPAFLDKHFGPFAIANWGAPENFVASKATDLSLQRVRDIHLRSHLDDELEINGDINSVYTMAVIGFFIVVIVCFNFINLSTAQASTRAKEVGLRKVVGAFRYQLITQYLSESTVIAWMGFLFAIIFSWLALPWLNAFTGKSLSLNLVHQWPLFIGLGISTMFVGLTAGIYPALVISGFKPALVLKGKLAVGSKKGTLRKSLVVLQFAISIILIVATFISRQQLRFLKTEDLGYTLDNVVTLPYYEELNEPFDSFYNQLTNTSLIKNATRSSRIPTGRLLDSQGSALVTKGDSLLDTGVELKQITTDFEFFKTYNIDFVGGRDFSKNISTDDSTAYVINEAAARAIGWNPVSDGLGKDFMYGGIKGKLIGIVNDFHFESLHQRVVPMVFLPVKQSYYHYLTVKISSADLQAGLDHLKKTWQDFLPNRPFEFQFISERYRQLYDAEQKENILFGLFSSTALFIAALGLFGLTTFSTIQRIKEIGIRKVMGASLFSILKLLSGEIVTLIILANIIAWPIAWYLMGQWLEGFAYHIEMNLFVYFLGACVSLLLALLTVCAHTVRAAMTNPSKILRYE